MDGFIDVFRLISVLIWQKRHAHYDIHTSKSCLCSSRNNLWELKFPQQCSWWLSSSGIWHCVARLEFPWRFGGPCHLHLQGSRFPIRKLNVGDRWRYICLLVKLVNTRQEWWANWGRCIWGLVVSVGPGKGHISRYTVKELDTNL